MQTRFPLSNLIPAEFNVEAVHDAAGAIVVAASADRLGFLVSNDTLLRTVRRYDRPAPVPPNVIGIDDCPTASPHQHAEDRLHDASFHGRSRGSQATRNDGHQNSPIWTGRFSGAS